MRTIFVNPSTRRGRSRTKTKRRPARKNPKTKTTSLAAYKKGLKDAMQMKITNPRRRRRRKPVTRRRAAAPKRRVRRRARRRNAGITPFVANPLILNPRRRRRSNPAMKLNVKSALKVVIASGAGSALGVALNGLALNKVQNPWLRNGLRLGAAVGVGLLLGGRQKDMAAAASGAVLYPLWQEVATRFLPAGVLTMTTPALPVGADLDVLSADLDAALSGYTGGGGGNDFNPIF